MVHLTKRNVNYGFMLKTHYEQNLHYIDRVIAGSPADQAGLKNMDRVFAINNVSLAERNHAFAVKLIAKYKSQVYMEILAASNKWLSSIKATASQVLNHNTAQKS